MAIPLAQYLAEADVRDQDNDSLETCNACSVALQEAIHGYRKVNGAAHCSDCYFDELSELIDEHPIGRPMASHFVAS